MTTSEIQSVGGQPVILLNQKPVNPTTAYVGPQYVDTFLKAGIRLFTFSVSADWWIGREEYAFDEVDSFIKDYVARIPGAFFMPRINLASQGYPWWGKEHPDEMDLLLDIKTGKFRDPLLPNPLAVPYLGHEVNLQGINLHSFHSSIWREQAGQAVTAIITHCEAMDYADKIWAWHLCDGLFCEWFHWHEYSFGAMSDYSPAAQQDFRQWLRRHYKDDEKALSKAWGRELNFDQADVPLPAERMRAFHGDLYDPGVDRPTIDYSMCLSQATADSLVTICEVVKNALPEPKLTCVFYGYQFSNMPRPQLNAHYALETVLSSPNVDMIASPHAYGNRGEGGYHAPQALAETIRRAGKIHFDEVDCKTVWTPRTVTWKTHITQPTTVDGTIEMMKKDASYAISSGTAFWWMDLTDEGWFYAPEAVEPIHHIIQIEDRVAGLDRNSVAEIAFVVSQKAMHFIVPSEGLHNAVQKIFRNWHLSRIGAPFDTLEVDELSHIDLSRYKLFIMANLFYLSSEQRQIIDRRIKSNGNTILWCYAPGFQNDRDSSLENMAAVTDISFGMENLHDELNVEITRFDHPLTKQLSPGFSYGTGIDRDQYNKPPKIQYMPDTRISPAFFAHDQDAVILGLAMNTRKPGLVVKQLAGWKSLYSSAPVLSWKLLQNIACFAGVHLYEDSGDMVWANESFIAVYSQSKGRKKIHFPSRRRVYDAYTGDTVAESTKEIVVSMQKWETRLFISSDDGV